MGGRGPAGGGTGHEGITHKFFYFLKLTPRKQSFALTKNAGYSGRMTWHSLPNAPRKLQATEARLDAIYAAARNGLKGDALALAAGLLPSEYRQLCQFDPLADLAEQKGRADGEMEVSGILHKAARQGDAKAALEILKHAHGWTAKTAIDVNIDQTISVKHALEIAEKRMVDWMTIDGTITKPADALTSDGLLTNDLTIEDHGYEPTYTDRANASSDV